MRLLTIAADEAGECHALPGAMVMLHIVNAMM